MIKTNVFFVFLAIAVFQLGPLGQWNRKHVVLTSGGKPTAQTVRTTTTINTNDGIVEQTSEADSTVFGTGTPAFQQSNQYIDRSTRAVQLNVNLYNPSVDLFVTVLAL